jgi:hypothetical protein
MFPTNLRSRFWAVVSLAVCLPVAAAKDADPKQVYTDPAKADPDFAFQGEYAGELSIDGQPMKFGVQVVALGNGDFNAVGYPGGLPGAGWTPPNLVRGTGARRMSEGGDGKVVKLEGVDWGGVKRRGEIRDGAIVVLSDDGREAGRLPKVVRKSPTLGMKPPAGAIVVFDGAGLDGVVGGRLTDDKLLMEGVTSKAEFGDATIHLEFCCPYQPADRGQARGNSGAYLQGRYEVQILDSFGLEGKDNECGGIYSLAAPAVNMALPPLSWQTYDIDFTAPKFDGEKVVSRPRLTVRHNGVVIHEKAEVPKITPGGTSGKEGPKGPLHLQNHGNPVRFRNIWVLPKS